ncbi:MAG TPA: bifunctional DNA-formamidopyrimidine glycosylase/DNA-(apurinic or apyrimidinic site) lyase [Acidimicrobiales bacterium]|nr:bifunctional DNA-formamidopyrimidine glycosylase/DNA-(apurinic or apyrimidinic site) lyase [Acidimicrobiales bacterium]
MPELAEVETIRRDVEAEYAGRRITRVTATGPRSVRRHPDPAQFEARIQGRVLTGTARWGKYLVLDLDNGDAVVAHMGMSGQLLRTGADEPVQKHTHVRLQFDTGPDLRFVDPRTFGQMWVTTPAGGRIPELSHLGFDPLADPDAEARLRKVLARPTRLKPLLMDQSRVAGIGNMYADEILHAARLRPDRAAASLSAPETGRLYRSMVAVLDDAVRHRGSSLADEQYRDLFGRIGRYQEHHRVYAREGAPCLRCGTAITRVKANGRSSFFCPGCQI